MFHLGSMRKTNVQCNIIDFLLEKNYCHIDFIPIGIAIITISVVFQVFDKIYEKDIEALEILKISMCKNLAHDLGSYEQISSIIDKKINSLTLSSVFDQFRSIIMYSLGFILLASISNSLKFNFLNIINAIYLTFLVVIINHRITRLRQKSKDSKEMIKKCLSFLDDINISTENAKSKK